MTVKNLRVIPCVLLALMLAACSTTSPPTRYFQLESMAQPLESKNPDTKLLVVGPFHLPEYLDRPQLVTRSSSVEIFIDDFSRWAEPLDWALPRVVAANLAGAKDGLAAVDHRQDNFLQADYRLLGNIQRFDASESGRVLLVVRWWLQDHEGRAVTPSTLGRYQVEAQEAGDIASSVAAMNQALELFSGDVAQALDTEF